MPLKHSVEEITLKNGARGLFIHTPDATSVHYDIHFWAGTLFVDDPNRSQAAHIMEHLSFGANEVHSSPEAFSQDFSKNGAYHNARTSNIDMSYYVDAAHMEWERILDLQLLAISKPKYTEKGLKAEKGNVHEELVGYANNHRRILWGEIMRSAGLRRWYDPDELKTIDGVQLKDIVNHFERTHTTNNMHFVFAGDLAEHKDTIIAKLEAVPLKPGERLEIPKDVAKPTGPVSIVRKDLPGVTFQLVFFINRELTRDEMQTLSIVTHVLTGTFHSRIYGEARARGICYGMGSYYSSSPMGVADFSINGQVSLTNAQELFELIVREVKAVLKNGISEEELQQAKEYHLGSVQMSWETVSSLVNWYDEEYYETGRIDYLEDLTGRIEKTSREDVQKILKEFVETGLWTLGSIGNINPDEFRTYYDLFQEKLIQETVQ